MGGFYPLGYHPAGTGVRAAYVWPDPEPEGPILAPLAKLAELVAALPTFRAECGLAVDDPYASEKLLEGTHGGKRRIFFPEVDWDRFAVVPSVVLQIGTQWRAEELAGGAYQSTRPTGNLRLIPTAANKHPADLERSMRTYGVYLGNFLNELREQFGRDDCLAGTTIDMVTPPVLPTVQTEKSLGFSYWRSGFQIEWSA